MNKGLKHDVMCGEWKAEEHPCVRAADQWESDTESLAQERAYQQRLQTKYSLRGAESAGSSQSGDGRDEDEAEDFRLYDSLEVAARPSASSSLLQTEYLDTHRGDRESTSHLLSDDAYSDLRYDPNWRTNLREAGCFNSGPHISTGEYYPEGKSPQMARHRHELVIKEGHRYIADTSPAAVMTTGAAGSESDHTYRLHPRDGHTDSVTSPRCRDLTLQPTAPEAELSRTSSIFTKVEKDSTLQRQSREQRVNSWDGTDENMSRCPELAEEIHATYIQGSKNLNQQDLRPTRGGATEAQQTSIPSLKSPKVLTNKKTEIPLEDIVERNKITLGCSAWKSGSYVKLHALKQESPHNVNKVHETKVQKTASTESPKESSDPKRMWIQKTQQLRVTQISKGKKAQRKEYPKPPQQQPPSLGVRTERGDCLSSPLARPAAVTQPKPQKTISSRLLPPTIHLNINLNTSSQLLSSLQQKDQDAIINLASLHGCSPWSPASEVELALHPRYQQTNPGMSSHVSQKGVNTQFNHRNQRSSPEQWKRPTLVQCPLSCEGEDQTWSTNEVHSQQFPQNLSKTLTAKPSPGCGSYTVLPPIRKPSTGEEPELSPGQCGSTADSLCGSSSDGYLVQMEKRKQLRARATYKAYSLEDYKQLKGDIHLRGLGPDYTAVEKTKMKRQRLYSNVIREQNKKIRRIPFLLTKDPEVNDKKVPRMKALEYAKTIAKPPVQSQPKQRQNPQPATEMLRKRHEEERQTVAQDLKQYMLSEARCSSHEQSMEPMLYRYLYSKM